MANCCILLFNGARKESTVSSSGVFFIFPLFIIAFSSARKHLNSLQLYCLTLFLLLVRSVKTFFLPLFQTKYSGGRLREILDIYQKQKIIFFAFPAYSDWWESPNKASFMNPFQRIPLNQVDNHTYFNFAWEVVIEREWGVHWKTV